MLDVEILAKLPLFRDATPAVLAALAKFGVEIEVPAGTVLFLTGSAPRGWYIVIEGTVRVVRGAGARQHVIHTETRGGTLGEVPLFTQRRHPATAIAVDATRCILFDRAALESAIAAAPAIAFIMAARLAHRTEQLVERLHERSATSVQSRLIEFLISRRPAKGTDAISLGMTQQALAEELGTVREVVGRELRALAQQGWIESLGKGRFRLLDPAALLGAARPAD